MSLTPPMLKGIPVLGNLLDFRRSPTNLISHGYQQFGEIFAFQLGRQPVAVLLGPEHQKTFFLETDKAFHIDKPYRFLEAMFGKIAFTAGVETYQNQRHILHDPFRRARMIVYIDIMVQEVQNWLDSLGDQGTIDLYPAMQQLTQKVAAHCLMGKEFRDQMDTEFWSLYADLAQGIDFLLPPNLPLPKFIRRDRAKKKMHQLLTPIIQARRESQEDHNDFLQDFVDARLKDGGALTNEQVINFIIALIFAGHETTSSHISWALIHMLQHPAFLKRIQTEIEEFAPPETLLDHHSLANLQHIDWALHETERILPVAEMLLRYVDQEVEIGGYKIPHGWLALVSPSVGHRLPDWFADSETYDPLRFAPDREEHKQHKFTLIGFGGGVHKCAGMNFAYNEMTIITALMFQQFQWTLETPDPKPQKVVGTVRPESTILRYKRKVPLQDAGEKLAPMKAAI